MCKCVCVCVHVCVCVCFLSVMSRLYHFRLSRILSFPFLSIHSFEHALFRMPLFFLQKYLTLNSNMEFGNVNHFTCRLSTS